MNFINSKVKNKMIVLLTTGLALALGGGCSHAHHAKEVAVAHVEHAEAAPAVAAVSPGAEYAVVKFQKGSHALSDSGRQEINRIANRSVNEGRKINDIKILAWADREYPNQGIKANSKDVHLAGDRADVIKSYIKHDLNTNAKVDEHNMAKRPGFLSELVKTEDFKIKNKIENSGLTKNGTANPFLGKKESKALVLITYE